MLKRKIDKYLEDWRQSADKKPLIVKGARQVGKTASIRYFGEKYYKYIVEINFALQPKYKQIFVDGYEVKSIIKNITLLNPSLVLVPHETLLFFDELQEYPDCATSLKSFKQDGRYDVICSGSLMGLYYQQIESNSVGYKIDYEMYSLDFEEFLWAKGYDERSLCHRQAGRGVVCHRAYGHGQNNGGTVSRSACNGKRICAQSFLSHTQEYLGKCGA